MPVKVHGAIGAQDLFLRLDTTAKRRVMVALIKKAREIAALARKMAPIDEGNLEKAIKVRGDDEGRARDDAGRFIRREVDVYIDTDMPVPERPGKTVGDYAYEIHEHLAPLGWRKLGPRSAGKQAGQSEIVGGGFLERAAVAVDKSIDQELLDIVRSLV